MQVRQGYGGSVLSLGLSLSVDELELESARIHCEVQTEYEVRMIHLVDEAVSGIHRSDDSGVTVVSLIMESSVLVSVLGVVVVCTVEVIVENEVEVDESEVAESIW